MNVTELQTEEPIRATASRLLWRWSVTLIVGLWPSISISAAAESKGDAAVEKGQVSRVPIKVVNPHRLPDEDIAAVRTPLGIPDDYKPWIARLGDGRLLIVAFCYGGASHNELPEGVPYLERAVFWRSDDGGSTWGPRQERPDIHGREFSLNCLADGTLIMPCCFLQADAANRAGHTYSKVFRSTDNGQTWSELRVGPGGFPPKAQTVTEWTVVELPDPKDPERTLVMLGVSMQLGRKLAPSHVFLWRSWDGGRTWDKTLKPDTDNWIDVDGFFSQSVTYRAASGRLLHVVRVDATGPHWRLPDDNRRISKGDQGDRSMLWESTDNGRTWRRHHGDGRFGAYGEMYPRFLRLKDGRLLLTFTVRSSSTDGYGLGLRGLVSYDDGQTWDFSHDRIVIAYENHGSSGGGFGNTIQLDDEALVSCYSYRGRDGKTHVEAVRWKLPKPRLAP